MPPTDAPPTDSAETVHRYVAALQAGDEPAIRDLFADDATWTLAAGELPISGTWRGRDTILDEFLATALDHYQAGSIAIDVTGMIAEGDRVVLEWTTRALTRDGRPYENGCVGVFTVRQGRIQAVREYMDTLYAGERAFAGPRSALLPLLGTGDAARLEDVLAEEVVFHSPVRDYHGRADVAHVLATIGRVLDDVEGRRTLTGPGEAVALLAARCAGRGLTGTLHEIRDADGRVASATLLLRPLSALREAIEAMGAELSHSPLPSRA